MDGKRGKLGERRLGCWGIDAPGDAVIAKLVLPRKWWFSVNFYRFCFVGEQVLPSSTVTNAKNSKTPNNLRPSPTVVSDFMCTVHVRMLYNVILLQYILKYKTFYYFTVIHPRLTRTQGDMQGRLSLSTLATNAPRTILGENFITSLTLSFNTQKCEFCAQI